MEEFGYTVLDVYQIWHFDKINDGIFRSFVDHWAALKFRSSGMSSANNNSITCVNMSI